MKTQNSQINIICITPIKHLNGVFDLISNFGNVLYEPEINKKSLKKTLFETQAEYLFTNPNKQNFILDEEVLINSNLKVINTCSTGLNHIDLDFCKKNEIELIIHENPSFMLKKSELTEFFKKDM